MKSIRLMLAGASLLLLCSCGAQVQKETQVANANESKENAVIETIMSRRSIRQYKPQAVNRDTTERLIRHASPLQIVEQCQHVSFVQTGCLIGGNHISIDRYNILFYRIRRNIAR